MAEVEVRISKTQKPILVMFLETRCSIFGSDFPMMYGLNSDREPRES